MFLGYLKQSTASQIRVLGPFVDQTDGFTAETGLTIANTDVKLSKNGAAQVNKNSGGGTHLGNGDYAFTFDATDTNTVGALRVSISVAGARIVVGDFTVLEEAVYDAVIAGSQAEPGQGAPPATTDVFTKLAHLYQDWRNLKTLDKATGTRKLYADDGTTVVNKATVTDNGTISQIAEKVTGP